MPPQSGQISILFKSEGFMEVLRISQLHDSFEHTKLFCLFSGCILNVTLPCPHFGHVNLL